MQLNEHQIKIDASGYKVAIVASIFHKDLAEQYIANTVEALQAQKVRREDIQIIRVLGSLEIPYICKRISGFDTTDIIIALGIIIRGETSHYDLVAENTYSGLMKIQLEDGKMPIGFGILTCENIQQAQERVDKNGQNKGLEVANSTLLQEYIIRNQL